MKKYSLVLWACLTVCPFFLEAQKVDSVKLVDPRDFPSDTTVTESDETYGRPTGANKKYTMKYIRKFIREGFSGVIAVNPITGAVTFVNDQMAWAKLTQAVRDSILAGKNKATIYSSNGTIPATRTLEMTGSLLYNNSIPANSTTYKGFLEIRQKWPGNSSKWLSITDFYEARSSVAHLGLPTWYKLMQYNGGANYEWGNGIAVDSTNGVYHYTVGGRYSPSILNFSIARPSSGTAYQTTPGLTIGYNPGNGLGTSDIFKIYSTVGGGATYFDVRQDGRITFGNNNTSNSYYFPVVSPGSGNKVLRWVSGVPEFSTIETAITGTARVIPYMNTGGRYYAGNTYFKIDTNTTSGAQARVRLLINNPNGDAGEGDSYSSLSVRTGDGLGTEAIANFGDQALTNATTGYDAVMQLYRSGGNFTTKSNLTNGMTVGKFAWRGQVNGGSRALGHVLLNYTGDGTTITSEIIGVTAVSGSLVSGWKLDNTSKFWLGSGADDYSFPATMTQSNLMRYLPVFTSNGTVATGAITHNPFGVASGTTDGSGDLLVTFAGTMPDATYSVRIAVEGTTSMEYTVHTKTTTTFKVRFYGSTTGTALPATSVTVNYDATDY